MYRAIGSFIDSRQSVIFTAMESCVYNLQCVASGLAEETCKQGDDKTKPTQKDHILLMLTKVVI